MNKRKVQVKIAGKDYAVRTEEDEEWLQHVARLVDDKMAQIKDRTGMVDTFDIAMLTCLNLAREVHDFRESRRAAVTEVDDDELKSLIEIAEAAIARLPDLEGLRLDADPLLPLGTRSAAQAPRDGGR